MPFKTEHGTHYHMKEGCNGATIPCGTEGLTPCSICCEGSSGSVGGFSHGVTGSQAGGSPGGSSVGTGSHAGGSPDLGPVADEVARLGHATDTVIEDGPTNAGTLSGLREDYGTPVGMPEPAMSSRDFAKRILSGSDRVMAIGTRRGWHRLPVIGYIGEGIQATLGGLSLSIRERWHERKERKALVAIAKREGCSDWEARCLMAEEEGRRLARTRRDAETAIQRQMAWDAGRSNPRTRDDIVIDSILRTSERVARRWGVTDDEALSTDGFIGLIRATHQAIEETGYGDKITTETIHRMKQRLALPKDRTNFITCAMEDARDRERMRTHEGAETIAQMRARRQVTH